MESTPTPGLGEEVIRLARLLHALKACALGHEVDRSALHLLAPLVAAPMRSKDLAESVHVDPSTVSRQVTELVARGLVERRADPRDGRSVLLHATAAGTALFEALRSQREHLLDTLTKEWSAEDRSLLATLLSKLNTALAEQFEAAAQSVRATLPTYPSKETS